MSVSGGGVPGNGDQSHQGLGQEGEARTTGVTGALEPGDDNAGPQHHSDAASPLRGVRKKIGSRGPSLAQPC